MRGVSMSPIENLVHSTIRIECDLENGISSGSGYFFAFNFSEDKRFIPCIVTNKHVISGAITGRFHITLADNNGDPILGQYETIELEHFEQNWIPHPDSKVDLTVLPIGPILHKLDEIGKKPYYVPLGKGILPSKDMLDELSSIEDIVMIGYPNGLWDSKHNLPIIRKGITATHPKLNYNGRAEFLIDAACFPGSSGSPVFLANLGSFTNKEGELMAGYRIALLGTLYAGPQHTATGDIIFSAIPQTITNIPNNLGLVIRYDALSDFEPILSRLIG